MNITKIKKFRIIKYKHSVKPALKIKNVSKTFNGVPVLQNLNLNILPGSINGLLGENGSGKTTLFNLILGILKADEGEIYAKGNTLISSMPIHERCTKFRISYVPQKESLFQGLSCEDNIKGLKECKSLYVQRPYFYEGDKNQKILTELHIPIVEIEKNLVIK